MKSSVLAATVLVVLQISAGWCLAPKLRRVTTNFQHGEGPHWDEEKQVLFFVDIDQEFVNRYDPSNGNVTSVRVGGGGVSLVIPVKGTDNKFIVTRGRDIVLLTWDGVSSTPEEVTVITSVEQDKPGNRWNDGKADRTGRIWAGTMGPEAVVGVVTPDQAAFYSLDPDSATAVSQLRKVTTSNGLAWSANGKLLYYIDTPTLRVDVFDFDIIEGKISNRRTAFDLQANNVTGFPDGMTIDADGNLWVACFNGGKVINVDPRAGTLLQEVMLPATRVTSVAFGGPRFETLYVTTSQLGLTAAQMKAQPLAGSVFSLTGLGVRGQGAANKAVRSALKGEHRH